MESYTIHHDGLIMSDKELSKYNGHHKIDKYYFSSASQEPEVESVSPKANLDELKQWLRPTKILPEDLPRWNANPALKILMIQTHNDFSKRPLHGPPKDPSHRTIPGQTEVRPLDDCVVQGNMVKEIMKHAKLPLAALEAYIHANITFQTIPSYHFRDEEGTFGGDVTSYYCSGTSWSVAWSYFHATRHTSAVMFYREGDGDDRRRNLEHELRRLQHHIPHPLLLAYIKIRISLFWTFNLLQQMNGQTFEIEGSVGLATWDWVLDRELEAPDCPEVPRPSVSRARPEETRFSFDENIAKAQKRAVERYNVLSSKLTNIRFRLRSFREQIVWIRRSNQEYSLTLKGKTNTRRRECSELNSMLHHLTDFVKVYLHDADTLDDRLRQQMFVMSQLVNQRDSRIGLAIADLNFDLAWQGKHVNVAMMAIGVVTFICLPTATIAGVFQTPIFNWQSPPDGPIVTEPFWIFWAVCGSTTMLLALCWLLYMRRKRRGDRLKKWDARNEFRQSILRFPTKPQTARRKGSISASSSGRLEVLSMINAKTMIDEELGLGVAHAVSTEGSV